MKFMFEEIRNFARLFELNQPDKRGDMKRILRTFLFVFVCATGFGQTLPDITSISPTSGPQGATVSLTVTGAGFVTGTTLAVSGRGLLQLNTRITSPTTVLVTAVLIGSPGKYTLRM